MRPLFHVVAAGLLAAPAGALLAYDYSLSCSKLTCGSALNEDYLSLGVMFAFASVVEILMVFRRRKTGALVWETGRQRLVRRLGTLMAIAGGIASVATFFEFPSYPISLYSAVAVCAVGFAMLLSSTMIGMKQETWRKQLAPLPHAA